MHSLFLKIFLWFWIAMTVAMLALVASGMQYAQQSHRRWQRMTGDAFSVYADTAAEALEEQGGAAANEYLAELEKRTGIRSWLFDTRTKKVASYYPRQSVFSSHQERQVHALVERARANPQTEFEPAGSMILAARQAASPAGRHYVLIGELPRTRFGPWEDDSSVQLLRFVAVLLTAGLVCWGLGRYLTVPIVTIRDATRRLAEGDISARPGAQLGRRNDELAGLAHDFDRMAERMEGLLEEQNHLLRTQRQLLGDVSHELRSPLARVNVAVELARDHLEAQNTSAVAQSLGRIERETVRQSEMVDRLLMVARLESGLEKRGVAQVDLQAMLQSIVADADYEATSHQRRAHLVKSEKCYVCGTPDLLRSMAENVVRNAVRYTGEGKAVEVSLTCLNAENAVIQVLDEGPGVAEDELENIFRPFHRTASARDRASGGTGLGLTIAARAVELHGGSIRASNRATGGLCIEITLPLSDRSAPE